jgi:hypothetical protein
MTQMPITGQTGAGQPFARQPAAEEQMAQSMAGHPNAGQPMAVQPTAGEPTVGQPTTGQPIVLVSNSHGYNIDKQDISEATMFNSAIFSACFLASVAATPFVVKLMRFALRGTVRDCSDYQQLTSNAPFLASQ